jgi:hypothetical protein
LPPSIENRICMIRIVRLLWLSSWKISLACMAMSVVLVATASPPRRILFIGNSLTYKQRGLYYHLEKLAASAKPSLIIQTGKSVQGGATLKTHWEKSEPQDLIAKGAYDVVVLQEDIPETDVASFREYARRFVAATRQAKARPILLMAWSYPRLGWISTAEIARAHRDAAKELGVEVAPVGLAWQRSMQERPDLDLYVADREHPSIYGTYLATSVLYATIFKENPAALGYVPPGLSAAAATYLRRVAWEICQEWNR